MSKYFIVNTGIYEDDALCFFDKQPIPMGNQGYKIDEGIAVDITWAGPATLTMEDDEPGTTVGGLIGNTNSQLIVHNRIADAMIARHNSARPIQRIPLIIYDHEKKIASESHCLLNPIGAVDCLDRKRSECAEFPGDRSVLTFVDERKVVLVRDRLDPGAALFRIAGWPRLYVIRQDACEAIKALGLAKTNIYLHPVALSD